MNPKIGKKAYYFLSCTWGIFATLAGGVMALALIITGHKPKRWGYAWYFEAGENWGGASLGPFFVKDRTSGTRLMNHEFGHSIQNCYFGPLMPFLVSIPSSARYRYRDFREKVLKKPSRTPYDSVWFEGQATRLGTEFMDWYIEKQRGDEK